MQEDPGPRIGAIVVAAGNSHRMGDVDKITVPLVGKPVITYSLDILEQNPLIGQVVLVAPPLRVNQFKALMDDFNYFKISVVAGGSRRQDSVRNGLVALNDTDWVLVHDGARPFIDQAIIELGLEAVLTTGAAAAASARWRRRTTCAPRGARTWPRRSSAGRACAGAACAQVHTHH